MTQLQQIDYSVDYYAILQVPSNASGDEIHRAFKRLVLEHHPDKNPDARDWSEKRIRELIEANSILGDPERRRVFDRVRSSNPAIAAPGRNEEPFFFRKKGPGARALMVLHLLLNDRPGEAVGILEEQEVRHGGGFLPDYLDRRDYLDCLFLLAEHFMSEKRYLDALGRLKAFYSHDESAKYRRHYFDEVRRLLTDLYLRKLPRVLSPEQTIEVLGEASTLKLSPRENVARLKKVAESQARIGDRRGALETLSQIHSIDPEVKGLERIEALLAS